MATGETLKVGGQQVAVDQVPEKNLRWYASECRSTRLKTIAQRELDRRSGGSSSAATPQQHTSAAMPQHAGSLARAQLSSLAIEGNFRDPTKATCALKVAADNYHLVSPAPMVGNLPEGCALALSVVRIDPADPHLYKVGDKVALDKTHLTSIANAIGASTVYSRRTDDGSHPHYCAWTVKVRYRQFDGTWLARQGSVEMDLRAPHGAEYVDAVKKAESKGRDPAAQLGELRKFITRHAESKALNRAYAALGIRRAYTRSELERPFAVARLTFTGESEDPEARAQFRAGIMASFLGSTNDAFGEEDSSEQPPPRLVSPPPPPPEYHQPPTYEVVHEPAHERSDDYDDEEPSEEQVAAGDFDHPNPDEF